jgi:hypothetical protein
LEERFLLYRHFLVYLLLGRIVLEHILAEPLVVL